MIQSVSAMRSQRSRRLKKLDAQARELDTLVSDLPMLVQRLLGCGPASDAGERQRQMAVALRKQAREAEDRLLENRRAVLENAGARTAAADDYDQWVRLSAAADRFSEASEDVGGFIHHALKYNPKRLTAVRVAGEARLVSYRMHAIRLEPPPRWGPPGPNASMPRVGDSELEPRIMLILERGSALAAPLQEAIRYELGLHGRRLEEVPFDLSAVSINLAREAAEATLWRSITDLNTNLGQLRAMITNRPRG